MTEISGAGQLAEEQPAPRERLREQHFERARALFARQQGAADHDREDRHQDRRPAEELDLQELARVREVIDVAEAEVPHLDALELRADDREEQDQQRGQRA